MNNPFKRILKIERSRGMTTLFRQAGPEENQRVYVIENATLSPEQAAALGDADGLCGGSADNPGPYVPLRPEHAAELREAARVWEETYGA